MGFDLVLEEKVQLKRWQFLNAGKTYKEECTEHMLNIFRAWLFENYISGADGSCRKEWNMGTYGPE